MLKFIKPLVFVLSLLPLVLIIHGVINNSLGANPIESITHSTGTWALRFLLLTLCATPLRGFFGWAWPLRIRRMLGLYVFFYAGLHFTTYVWLDQFFDWASILVDIGKRPYVTVGFIALVLLIPLAATSNKFAIRKLSQRWKALHKLVYPIAVLVLLHYIWLVKADLLEPVIYLLILIFLFAYRLVKSLSGSSTKHTAQSV